MKHVKKFEHFTGFDLGRFSEEEGSEPEFKEIEKVEDTEDCAPCETEESDEDEDFTQTTTDEYESEDENNMRRKVWGDEVTVEKITSFRQFEAKKEAKKPTTKKEKELAAKYPPKDKITKGDFITAAIENKKKGKEDNKDKEDKKEDKKPKFGSKEWQEKYGKKKK
jgi:hypothetical protein